MKTNDPELDTQYYWFAFYVFLLFNLTFLNLFFLKM